MARLVTAGLSVAIAGLLLFRSRTAVTPTPHPKVGGAPVTTILSPPMARLSHTPSAMPVSKASWGDLARGTQDLLENDTEGFALLESRAKASIDQAEGQFYRSLYENRPKFAAADFHQSFFVIRELARYGRNPTGLLDALLTPGKEKENGRLSGHLEPLTEAERLQRLRSYGFREVRRRLTAEPQLLKSHSCEDWWSLAAPYAQKDPSLDVAIEAIEILKMACPPDSLPQLVSTRSERDRRILGNFLRD